MKIAVASPPYPESIENGLYWIDKFVQDAALQQAEIICFPESYLPGYPATEFKPESSSPEKLQSALQQVCKIAADNAIAIIIPMDWYDEGKIFNVAWVISNNGEPLGYQTKNQLDPSEDNLWAAGTERAIYEVNGVKIGITICHEGFRYPESARWAAMQGAKIVFHPNCTGSNIEGSMPVSWGDKETPYYEKAQMMRAMENTIYVATSNYAFDFPDSASAIIGPDGACVAWQPYREPGVTVAEIDVAESTGLLASRFKADLYYK